MNELLNQLQALAVAASLTDRTAVLKIIEVWSKLKKALLVDLKNRPVRSVQEQQDIQGAIDLIEIVNIWPWGGSLETILQNVGTQTVLDHWIRCVNLVREVMQGRTSVQSPSLNIRL